jgi:2,4-dienoyl-CoA reductase (NADPH2)
MKQLFTPRRIGSVTVKNRIVMPAMHLNYTPDGEINSKVINFYRERARGGAGLIIVGGCSIDDVGAGPMMIKATEPSYLEGLKKLADGVKSEGAMIAAQLYQAGRYAHSVFSGKQAVAPSAVPSRLTRETPRELTVEEIKGLIETFARAALLIKEAGFTAVEILASAGYIIPQFLSPLTNQRQDEYGGDFTNRMRFGLEVAAKVKEAVGNEYPVIVRVGGNDFMPGGNTNTEIREFCRHLEKTGIDCFNVTGGWHETRVPQLTMRVPQGNYVYLAENIKNEVSIPVIACNRINDAELAEEIIAEGRADFVGIARGMIADSEFANKAQQGLSRRIRKCIGCNQGCLDKVFSLQQVTCLVNPAAGREEEAVVAKADKVKNVLIVGGGIAGMEAARVLALRGHKVSIREKSGRLGGQIHLAAAPPGREDFLHLVDYLENELAELKVEVSLNREATSDAIVKENFDAVIIATGASAIKPQIPGIDGPNVAMAWDVLSGSRKTGKNVVVIGGGAVGVETALMLAEQGTLSGESLKFLLVRGAETPEVLTELATKGKKNITIIEMMKGVGRDIGISTRWTMLDDLERCAVNVMDKTKVCSINDEGVIVEADGEEKTVKADTVILAVGVKREAGLYEELKERVPEIYVIGDAESPQKALEAIHSAFDTAVKI